MVSCNPCYVGSTLELSSELAHELNLLVFFNIFCSGCYVGGTENMSPEVLHDLCKSLFANVFVAMQFSFPALDC